MGKLKDEKVKLNFYNNEVEAVFELRNLETFKILSKTYTIEKIELKLKENNLVIAFLTTKGEKLVGFRAKKSTLKEAKEILKKISNESNYKNMLVDFLENGLKECDCNENKCSLLNG